MNTLIISSSKSQNSKSAILCYEVANILKKKGAECNIIDIRNKSIVPTHDEVTKSMKKLEKKIKDADNIIIGMGIHCYSINDSLKILLDNCFSEATGKFYGILCAAGGDRSYLSTMHLTQICMNQWRMIQLPRIVYATKSDFKNNIISSNEVKERIKLFCEDFLLIGNKLLN